MVDITTSCPGPGFEYETPNNLHFTAVCANFFSAGPGSRLATVNVTNIKECMDACSTFRGPPCISVYMGSETECRLFKTRANFTQTDDDTLELATVSREDLVPLPLPCPYADASTERATSNGMPFTISCDHEYPGSDMDFSAPAALGDTSAIPSALAKIHTATMSECLDRCAANAPLCLGVTWNPDLARGWPNCHPKAANDARALARPSNFTAHSALAAIPAPDPACREAQEYEARGGGKTFRVACGNRTPGPDLRAVNQPSLAACMDACAVYRAEGGGGGGCAAVDFDGTGASGFLNCRFRAEVGDMRAEGNWSTAVVIRSEVPGESSPTTPGRTGSDGVSVSAGAIAGVVVGVASAIAIVGAVVFWWRRRRSQLQRATDEKEMVHEIGHGGTLGRGSQGTKPPAELDVGPVELQARLTSLELEVVERAQEVQQKRESI